MTFIRSFLIAGIVAVLFGFGLKNVFGFWEAAALAFVLQFIIAFIYTSIKISKNTVLTQEFENELEQLLSLSEASVACPCGNYTYTDNLFVNLENGYTCEKCNNEFRIDISLTPTLLTIPVNAASTNFDDPGDDVSITQQYDKGDPVPSD
tara:strand:- start:70 stop:519 length:450 start_codon:yes stop_codon:yes gene_type:complete